MEALVSTNNVGKGVLAFRNPVLILLCRSASVISDTVAFEMFEQPTQSCTSAWQLMVLLFRLTYVLRILCCKKVCSGVLNRYGNAPSLYKPAASKQRSQRDRVQCCLQLTNMVVMNESINSNDIQRGPYIKCCSGIALVSAGFSRVHLLEPSWPIKQAEHYCQDIRSQGKHIAFTFSSGLEILCHPDLRKLLCCFSRILGLPT